MYGRFIYIWQVSMVNEGKYTILWVFRIVCCCNILPNGLVIWNPLWYNYLSMFNDYINGIFINGNWYQKNQWIYGIIINVHWTSLVYAYINAIVLLGSDMGFSDTPLRWHGAFGYGKIVRKWITMKHLWLFWKLLLFCSVMFDEFLCYHGIDSSTTKRSSIVT